MKIEYGTTCIEYSDECVIIHAPEIELNEDTDN